MTQKREAIFIRLCVCVHKGGEEGWAPLDVSLHAYLHTGESHTDGLFRAQTHLMPVRRQLVHSPTVSSWEDESESAKHLLESYCKKLTTAALLLFL